jgi:uncharacterized protein (DUF1778 family)
VNDDSRLEVSPEVFDELLRLLNEPPRPNPRMVELLRRTRGTVTHVGDDL